MSSRDRSRERSPPGEGNIPKKTKEGSSDEDVPMPPAEESHVPPTPEKAGGSARRAPTSTRTPTKKGKHHASPRSSSKSRGKSPLARIGYSVRSLFGLGGSKSSPSKRGEASSTRSSQSGSSKGSKPFIGPLLPEGYIPYSRSELDRIAEYYRQNSFLNRGVGITEYIPFGPGAEVTIPWTTPPPRSAPTYSTAPSGSASSSPAAHSKTDTTTSAPPGPLMSPPTLPYSLALGREAMYPELSSLAKSYTRAGKSTKQLFPNLTAVAASQAKAPSPPKERLELPTLSAIAMVMASIGPGSSSGAAASQPPQQGSEFIQPDGQEPSCSGMQRTEFRDESSTSTSDYSPDVPPKFVQPPIRPQPPPPADETEEERLKRLRRKK